ncbi:hypothetical protein MCEMRE130_00464 [Candidatus Nanopelagicaceae bacterium]
MELYHFMTMPIAGLATLILPSGGNASEVS